MNESNETMAERVARAVLYEGYILYPYRPSVKNRQRWTFGGIYPRAYSEAQHGSDGWTMQAQCLVEGGDNSAVDVNVRFLHLTARSIEESAVGGDDREPAFRPVESLDVDGRRFQTWQEAVERRVELAPAGLADLAAAPRHHDFAFPHRRETEMLRDAAGRTAGRLVREQHAVEGTVEVSADATGPGLFRLTVRVLNRTPFDAGRAARDDAVMRSFASSHIVLGARGGAFVSATDPPDGLRAQAADCHNVGCWPVLAGEAGAGDTMLCSPIILPDYPQIAAESPGDLFDGAEIDEILTLRVLTLTDDEKRQAAAVDERAAAMLARTEALAREQLMNLHGTARALRPVAAGEPRNGPRPHDRGEVRHA